MKCEHRDRLQKEYAEAGAAFDTARERLHQNIGVLPKDKYDGIRESMNRAWDASQTARSTLDAHIREHGCGVE